MSTVITFSSPIHCSVLYLFAYCLNGKCQEANPYFCRFVGMDKDKIISKMGMVHNYGNIFWDGSQIR